VAGLESETGEACIRGIFSKGVKKHAAILMSLRVYDHTKMKKKNRKDPKRRHYESTGILFCIRKETYLAFTVLVVFTARFDKKWVSTTTHGATIFGDKIKGHHGQLFFCFGQSLW
jgi:hypothetical protein